MSQAAHSENDRLIELLVDRATVGLTESQAGSLQKLQRLLGQGDDISFDLTAAAIDLAVGNEELAALPDHLRSRAIVDANEFVESVTPVASGQMVQSKSSESGSALRTRDLLGLLAIAASIMLAAFIWFSRPPSSVPISSAEIMKRLVDQAPADLLTIDWKSTDVKEKNISGKVIWSDSKQAGVMTFKGLSANIPTVEQYQLWIFDKDRDQKFPVDGGVFDISDEGRETIVVISPKLKVTEATLFAITIEKRGGVVVSDRQRLPLIAQVGE